MNKKIYATRIDEDIEEVVREIEQLEFLCDNFFGVDNLHTVQEFAFCYFISEMGYGNYYETLPNMERFAVDFLSWQNAPIPETLFSVVGESFDVKPYSHADDFTWNSMFTKMKECARRPFYILRDEFPLTEKEMWQIETREAMRKESADKMEAILIERDIEARQNDG